MKQVTLLKVTIMDLQPEDTPSRISIRGYPMTDLQSGIPNFSKSQSWISSQGISNLGSPIGDTQRRISCQVIHNGGSPVWDTQSRISSKGISKRSADLRSGNTQSLISSPGCPMADLQSGDTQWRISSQGIPNRGSQSGNIQARRESPVGRTYTFPNGSTTTRRAGKVYICVCWGGGRGEERRGARIEQEKCSQLRVTREREQKWAICEGLGDQEVFLSLWHRLVAD